MTQEDIEKAAGDYSGSALGFRDNKAIMEKHKAFVDGANWRINSVWHDANEKPDTDKRDLLLIIKDGFGKEVYVHQNAYYMLKYGCVRWAYIEDLKPSTYGK